MSTPSIEIEEGMFAYGISPNSKREGVIGWISKINVEKKRLVSPIVMDVPQLGMCATLLLRIPKRHTKRASRSVSCTSSLSRLNHERHTKIVGLTNHVSSLPHVPSRLTILAHPLGVGGHMESGQNLESGTVRAGFRNLPIRFVNCCTSPVKRLIASAGWKRGYPGWRRNHPTQCPVQLHRRNLSSAEKWENLSEICRTIILYLAHISRNR